MRQTLVAIFFLAFAGEALAQTAPSGYTPTWNIRKWASGANPGADSLNANWTLIDSVLTFQRVDTVNWTGQTGAIASQNFASTTTGRPYEISYYIHTTFAGSGGTVRLLWAWNDGGAKTDSTSAVDVTNSASYASGVKVVYVSSGTPSWSTSITTFVDAPQYAVRMTLRRLW